MGRATVQGWVDDRAASMGAALSYYTFFSMAPLLLIVVSVAGLLLGREAVQGHLMDELVALFGPQAAASIQAMVASASEPAESWWGTVVGLGAMLLGATTVFAELQGALDRIWEVPDRPAGAGLWRLLRARVLSFGLILGLAFLLMVSLVVGAVVTALGRWWSSALGSWEWVAQGLNLGVGFVLTSAIFAMIYKLMPRAHVQWKDVWVGAVVTAVLFSVGKFLIGLYLGAVALAARSGIDTLFVLTEPRLASHFAKLGVDIVQIGGPVEHRGLRVPSMMHVPTIIKDMRFLVKPIWRVIQEEIEQGFEHASGGRSLTGK